MPLPFSRRALQTAPSFSRDFAGLKTLDHGVGPAITFTRASNATFFDASGTLQTAANDTPRFDHSATGSSLGLLIEEARTNQCTNSEASGAIGANGPTGWFINGTPYNGMTRTITTGTSNGMAYIDVRWEGTTTSGPFTIQFDARNPSQPSIAASSGQSWTLSSYLAIVAGSLPAGASLGLTCRGRNSAGSVVEENNLTLAPTSSLVRYTSTRTLNNATTTQVTPDIRVNTVPNGTAVDFTLRIAAPQLEQGAFATSYIPTTTAAATRAADSAVVTPISSFYNQAEGTLFAEYSPVALPIATVDFPRLLQVGNTTNNDNRNALTYWNNGGSLSHNASYFVATVDQLNKSVSTGSVGQTFKSAMAVASNSGHYAVNGSLVSSEDTSISMGPSADFTHFFVGRGATVIGRTAVHIRKIAYWPRRLSNTLLQQLTT
jgi:hypothetical protein